MSNWSSEVQLSVGVGGASTSLSALSSSSGESLYRGIVVVLRDHSCRKRSLIASRLALLDDGMLTVGYGKLSQKGESKLCLKPVET